MNSNEPTTGEIERLNGYIAREFAKGPSINVAAVTQAAIDEIVAREAASAVQSTGAKVQQPIQRRYSYWVGSAALAFSLLIIATVWNGAHRTTSKTASVAKTYSTISGQRASITLADGSTAVLAPATTLRVTGRNIELVGEAVFTVNQVSNSPFTVKTGSTVTRVLGTTFGVRKYATDASVRVVVAEGRVAVSSAVLSTGDLASVTDTSMHLSHNANVADVLAWAAGKNPRLVFQNTPVPEVLAQLERWCNVKFVGVDADLKHDMLSSTIEDTQLTRPTLELLGAALGRKVERRGQTIYLTVPE